MEETHQLLSFTVRVTQAMVLPVCFPEKKGEYLEEVQASIGKTVGGLVNLDRSLGWGATMATPFCVAKLSVLKL